MAKPAKSEWSLAQTVAWICLRDLTRAETIREHSAVAELEQATNPIIHLDADFEVLGHEAGAGRLSVGQAEAELKAAIVDGRVTVHGIRDGQGQTLPSRGWSSRTFHIGANSVLEGENDGWTELSLASSEVLRAWPAGAKRGPKPGSTAADRARLKKAIDDAILQAEAEGLSVHGRGISKVVCGRIFEQVIGDDFDVTRETLEKYIRVAIKARKRKL